MTKLINYFVVQKVGNFQEELFFNIFFSQVKTKLEKLYEDTAELFDLRRIYCCELIKLLELHERYCRD